MGRSLSNRSLRQRCTHIVRHDQERVERDLSGTIRLVRNWGRIGIKAGELMEIDTGVTAAEQALEALAQAKPRGDLEIASQSSVRVKRKRPSFQGRSKVRPVG